MTGTDFTAKDFRTWAATVLAATALREKAGPGVNRPASTAQAKKHVVRAIEAVAGILGNTPAICRKSYIHPAVLECYMDGSMARKLKTSLPASIRKTASKLKADELATLRLLHCARSTTERRKAA
jgi:DNA topoisomerase-1